VSLVIPELEGKIDGFALRVPTPTVSVVDLVAELEREGTTDELLSAFREAAEGTMKGILPLVSMDYKADSRSSIIDSQFTFMVAGNMAKVLTWYDNEWGYSVRTVDLAALMAKSL